MLSPFLRSISTKVYRVLTRFGVAPKPKRWSRSIPGIAAGGRWREMRQALAEEIACAKPRWGSNPNFHTALLERIEVLAFEPETPLMGELFNGNGVQSYLAPYEGDPCVGELTLNHLQSGAVRSALQQSVFIIWGAPSTGKTTVLSEIVRQFSLAGESTLLCSHTRKALEHSASTLSVAGLTAKTTTAVVLDEELRSESFDNVVIDEASMVELPTVLFLSSLASKRILFVGDPMQLGPIARSDTDLSTKWLKKDLFQHLAGTAEITGLYVWQERNEEQCVLLREQYRIPKSIFALTNQLYYGSRLTSVLPSNGRVTFINTSSLNPEVKIVGGSPVNEVHADIVIEEVSWMLEHGPRGSSSTDIGVITPFRSQQIFVKQLIKSREVPADVEVGTTYTFQGTDKLCLILDLTSSNVGYQFQNLGGTPKTELNAARMLNAALSRCRANRDGVACQLVVIANHEHFKQIYPESAVLRFIERVRSRADKVIQPHKPPDPAVLGAYSRQRISRFQETTDALVRELESECKQVIRSLSDPSYSDAGPVISLIEKYCEVIARLMRLCIKHKASDGQDVFRWTVRLETILEKLPVTALHLADLSRARRYATDSEVYFKDLVNELYILIYESSMRPSGEGFGRRPPPEPIFDPDAIHGKSYGRIRVWLREFRNFYDHDTDDWDEKRRRINEELRTQFFSSALYGQMPKTSVDYLKSEILILAEVVRYLGELEARLSQ